MSNSKERFLMRMKLIDGICMRKWKRGFRNNTVRFTETI